MFNRHEACNAPWHLTHTHTQSWSNGNLLQMADFTMGPSDCGPEVLALYALEVLKHMVHSLSSLCFGKSRVCRETSCLCITTFLISDQITWQVIHGRKAVLTHKSGMQSIIDQDGGKGVTDLVTEFSHILHGKEEIEALSWHSVPLHFFWALNCWHGSKSQHSFPSVNPLCKHPQGSTRWS